MSARPWALRWNPFGVYLGLLLTLAALPGCNRATPPAPAAAAIASESPQRTSEIIRPERVTLRHAIEQPGSIQAFEQTPIFSKIAGYVQKWNVDLGDRVKAGAILAELSVPELVEELQQKKALVNQAEKAYATAHARVATSLAQIREAEAGLSRPRPIRNAGNSKGALYQASAAEDHRRAIRSGDLEPVPGAPPRHWTRPSPRAVGAPLRRKRRPAATSRRPTSVSPRPNRDAWQPWCATPSCERLLTG